MTPDQLRELREVVTATVRKRYDAECGPTVVLALLDEIERLREALNDKHSKLQVDANIEREYSNRLRQQLAAMRAARDELADLASSILNQLSACDGNEDEGIQSQIYAAGNRIAALRKVGADQ